jgi:hypothetical protein
VEADQVHLNEGEKAADALAKILPPGHAATCIPVWSSQLPADMLEPLREKIVTVWVDRDPEGIGKARRLGQILPEVAAAVQFVQSATTGTHDDAYDHLAAGHKIEAAIPVTVDLNDDDTREAENGEGPRYRWLSASEIREARTPSALVANLIYQNSVHSFAAPPKTGKSLLMGQLCVCLASGRPFLGLSIPKPVRVGVFTLELAAGPYRERIERTCEDVGLTTPEWNDQLHIVAPITGDVPQIDFEALGHVAAIFDDAVSRGLEVLVFDTLQRFMVREEPEAVKRVYRSLSDAATRTGIAAIVVDETSKSWGGPETTTTASVAAYGSVFKGAIANVCMALQRRGFGDSATWTLTAEGHYPTVDEILYKQPLREDGTVGIGCVAVTPAKAHGISLEAAESVFRRHGGPDKKDRLHFPTKTKFREALVAEGMISGNSGDQADRVIAAIESTLAVVMAPEPEPDAEPENPIWVCKHGDAQNARRSFTWRWPINPSHGAPDAA